MEENSGSQPFPPPPGYAPPPAAPAVPPVISGPPRPFGAPAPEPPRRGRGWMVFAIVLLVLLTFSVLWNLLSFIGSLRVGDGPHYARQYGPRIEEAIISGKPMRSIRSPWCRLSASSSGRRRRRERLGFGGAGQGGVPCALEDEDVRAAILKADSPGGEVLASDEIDRTIVDFQKRRNGKPVAVFMGDVAASGGYYVSAPCRWVVARHPDHYREHLGVIMHGWNYRGLMNKVGAPPEVNKSGRFKDMMSGERSRTRSRRRSGPWSRRGG